MKLNSLKDRLSQWEILLTTVRPEAGEMPQLNADLAALERILQDGRALEALRGSLLEALRASSRTRKTLVKEGDETFRRLSLSLRGAFGPKSERLLKYGVAPEKIGVRKRNGRETPIIENRPVPKS